ncbi:NodT family RND efflux system, outer membrane lipoprotein [Lysobacter dokdonensis DS-58]|uniref:NodT family RND efflux system, outer membrane lipoprotein n=1 Tax=Lysobacter dokdonensis DS-58 TaxID=1300345 RepID=A0A0A2X478_9GAMM|nr:TolC family protein [Lysobacter dokdonensis]KGQ20044.1 NodT family RND efflux system, outer membrane lipoprotein [Lysobacter dokdonensis DS-58]
MRSRLTFASAFAAALLAGCATAPEPTSDEVQAQALGHVEVPQGWRTGANAAPVEAGWLATFGDPQLEALVAEALEHNPDLAIAAARMEQAEAQVDLATAQLKPAIGILGRAGSKPVSDLVAMLSGVMLRVAWEIDLWGRMRYARNAAMASRDASSADWRFARQSLAASVARTWFLATETAQQAKLANRMAEDAERLTGLADDRLRIGAGNETDVLAARASAANYRDAARQVELAHRQALRALETLVGRYPAAAIAAREDLVPFPGPVPAGMPADALDRRPDLLAAERRVAAAFDLVGEAKASFWPTLTLSGGYGRVSRDAINVQRNITQNTASASATTVIPLYTGGMLTGQVRLRTAEQREAVANYARLALQALDEVESALDAEATLATREELLRVSAEDSRRAAGLTETSYRIGKSDLRDVMGRQLSANASEVALLAVRRERLVRRVDLHLALGGDFVAAAPPTTGETPGPGEAR